MNKQKIIIPSGIGWQPSCELDNCPDWLMKAKQTSGPQIIKTTVLNWFLSDRTIGRAYGTLCHLSVCRLSVCDILYCGKTVHPSEKVSEGVNRKPGSKSSFLGSPPYFYFRFRHYGHQDGRFCLIFARIAQQLVLDSRN